MARTITSLTLFLVLWSSPVLAQTCGQDTMGHVYCHGPGLEAHGRVDEGGHLQCHVDTMGRTVCF